MALYLLRRLLYGALVLFGVNLLTFLLFFAVNTPDDMARLNLGGKHVTAEAIEAWKSAHDLQDPLFWNPQASGLEKATRTIFFKKSLPLLALEFGESDSGRDIASEIRTRMWPSLALALPTFLLGLAVVLGAAVLLVLVRGSRAERAGLAAAVLLMSISSLFFIILSQWLFAKVLRWFPVSGYAEGARSIVFLLLPIAAGILSRLGSDTLLFRAMLLEEAGKDYVRTARAKGLSACGKVDGFRFSLPRFRFSVPGHTESPGKILSLWKTNRSMEQKVRHIESIAEYQAMLGVETLHPLVGVIDFSEVQPIYHLRQTFGFYAIFLKEVKCGDMIYGRHYYDYQEGTLVCLAPGQVIGFEDTGEKFQPKGWALVFHPDLIRGTSLGRNMKEYGFFSYEVNEALHLSERERGLVVDCLRKIRDELGRAIDRHSRRLIAIQIEMLLDYCLRFYERQFITRSTANRDILTRFERLLDDYFTDGRARREGLPSVRYCAGELCLSPNYFGDLVKKETGRTAQEYIQLKLLGVAKELMLDPSRTIGEVAYELGFQYPQHFTRMFKKLTGQTPNAFRAAN